MVEDSSSDDMYGQLAMFAAIRKNELTGCLQPVLDLADSYGSLVSRGVVALGTTPALSRQDAVVRDLIGDVFDFLYEWPRPVFEGRTQVAYPVARRAYESLSLLSACYQDASIAECWDRGDQIQNRDIRKALAKLPLSCDENVLTELYRFFSAGTHPNRELVGERYLGNGNDFVLGSIGAPSLILTITHSIHLVEMWFWFGALVALVAREQLTRLDPSFGEDYLAAAETASSLKKWLTDEYNKVLVEENQLTAQDRRACVDQNKYPVQ